MLAMAWVDRLQTANWTPRRIAFARPRGRPGGAGAVGVNGFALGVSLLFGSVYSARFASVAPYFAQIASLYPNGAAMWRMPMTTARSALSRPYSPLLAE